MKMKILLAIFFTYYKAAFDLKRFQMERRLGGKEKKPDPKETTL
jgi:hypothetical protein